MWMDRSTHQRHKARSLCSLALPPPSHPPVTLLPCFPTFHSSWVFPQNHGDLYTSTPSFHPSCFPIVLCWVECVSLVRLLLSVLRPSLVSLPSLYLLGLLHKTYSAMTVSASSLQNIIQIRLVEKNGMSEGFTASKQTETMTCPHQRSLFRLSIFGFSGQAGMECWESFLTHHYRVK